MKIVKIVSLFVAAVFGSISLQAQTADEIVSKHIEAIGGADNWKKVTSIVETGAMSLQGITIEVTRTALHQKGTRQDLSIMGMNNYIVVTPTEGWMFMPVQQQTEAQKMPDEQLKEAQGQLDVQGAFIDYKSKGHSFELAGSETVDGVECFKLKMTGKNGVVVMHFIDKKTYNLVQSVRTAEGNELVTTFSNFKKLPEGIVVPMSSVVPLGNGMTAEYTVSKIEINKPIDETLFKPSK
jgi:hypothetical protein